MLKILIILNIILISCTAKKWTDIKYLPNGQVFQSTEMLDDVSHGLHKSYYFNGNILAEGYYKHSLLDSTWKYYYRNGDIKKEYIYSEGELLKVKAWDKSGKQVVVGGSGTFTKYYDDGGIEHFEIYLDNKPNGLWKSYYESQEVESKRFYEEGKKSGIWIFYNEDGDISHTFNFNKE